MSGNIAIALLAAGQARRFGGGKLDVLVAGRPLGRWALDRALALDIGRPSIVVATTPPQFAVKAHQEGLADLLVNAQAETGLAGSIAVAARAAAGSSGLLLMLADMPLVSLKTLRRLIAAIAPRLPAAVRHRGEGAGIPACFPNDMFAALTQLRGDRGAAILLQVPNEVAIVDVDEAELRDIDTSHDLAAVASLLSAARP
jgi:CTP:molybdopterin cytidylyltransferase MocA